MSRQAEDSNKNRLGNLREMGVIARMSQAVIGTLDYEEVLQIITDGMANLMELEAGAIYIIENEGELYLGATRPAMPGDIPDYVRRFPMKDHPIIEKTLSVRTPLLIEDTSKVLFSPEEKKIIEMRELRSLLYLPLIKGDATIGILILGSQLNTKTLSEEEIILAQTVANQLSVAIQNTRLHNELKIHKENLEQLVKDRTIQLESANEELLIVNEDLSQKNQLVQQQKEKLESALNHLKSMQSKLIQSEKMATIGFLTAGVAHEINNPLNYIMGGYIGLQNELDEPDFKKSETTTLLLNSIKTGLDRATAIVRGMNNLSRDNEKYDEDCDLHNIIDNCLTILHNRYKEGISIEKDYNEEKLITKGNTGKLHQLFMNLISNSIDSISGCGVIQIKTEVKKANVIVVITDNGCGIAGDDLPKIMEPFYTTKDPGKGTGLGLSIVNTIVHDHDGHIRFESNLNEGTSVSVEFPKL